ncbi:hypothetical protein H072_2269 [Dactylellina haptotyla CBS 200.50]|uniref:SCP domain-containing protein n=1 Tax=Dactylellina haptotyla (strain CBS 200.50) TaxID=1284197 RepID=S8ARX2_DACHA|nr:hypothetical protein H072_2269 [Dactylellina haptotyla CBS 200.50]
MNIWGIRRLVIHISMATAVIATIAVPSEPLLDSDLAKRDINNSIIAGPWKWSDDLGERQLYWVNKFVNSTFDATAARDMAQKIKFSDEECFAKGENNCLIGGCDETKGIGLYLCSYRPEGIKVPCKDFGAIASDIVDRWEQPNKPEMMVTDWTNKQVQAYSYWSLDPTWVTMYTMPCLSNIFTA